MEIVSRISPCWSKLDVSAILSEADPLGSGALSCGYKPGVDGRACFSVADRPWFVRPIALPRKEDEGLKRA